MDAQGNILAANDAFCNMLGYAQQRCSALTCRLDAQWQTRNCGRTRGACRQERNDRDLWPQERALIDVEISVSGVNLEGQDFIYASGRDITQRKQVEAALRRHKIVIDTAIDGFWMTDMLGNLQEANGAYAKMSGYSVDELTGMNISQLEALEPSPEEFMRISKKSLGRHDRFETRHRHKDGHEIDIEVPLPTWWSRSSFSFSAATSPNANRPRRNPQSGVL